MWIMTPNAFTSTVDKEGGLQVRTRDYGSALHLCKLAGINKENIVHAEDEALTGAIRDYPYRVSVTPEEMKRYVCAEIDGIDYTNFKNRAKAVRGAAYAKALNNVWVDMLALTPYRVKEKIRIAEAKWRARHPLPKGNGRRKGFTHEVQVSPENQWADAQWWYDNFPKRGDEVLENEEGEGPRDLMDADSDFVDLLREVDNLLEDRGKKSIHDLTEDEWRQLMEENPGGV